MQKITETEIKEIAERNGFEYAALKAVIMVEGSGRGYDSVTGKILIQFEPHWFRRLSSNKAPGVWDKNKVEKQAGEWLAFNDAFEKDAAAAMSATSIGMMQVMGFHWQALGFKSVGEMWDFAKESEANQVELGVRFIKKSVRLNMALVEKDWKNFAYYYNGPKYRDNRYDERLEKEYRDALN